MATENTPKHQPEDEEELAAEVTATNEGMPAGEIDEEPKDPEVVQSPEGFDKEKHRQRPGAPAGKTGEKHTEESRGAAAGE